MGTVLTTAAMLRVRQALKKQRKTVVFTNGTFDILHRGHVAYLQAARKLGDRLIVGLNTDASIRRIKGPKRPINPNRDRADVLAALACVDYVVLFGDDTPERLIGTLLPDVLVKGADWKKGEIVGSDIVEAHGGSVRRIRLTRGRSTTNVIQRVLDVYAPAPTDPSPAR
jgi:D-beta-D-heptose 7-phosphate kinase/D-beta-D-heptose 1-phosphate adenosyltransferase